MGSIQENQLQEIYDSWENNQRQNHICIQTGTDCGFPCFDKCPIYDKDKTVSS